PTWLVAELTRYQHVLQVRWRPARLNEQIQRFWSGHGRLWRWLCQQHPIAQLQDLQRRWLLDYIDQRLAAGYAASGVNQDLRDFHAFLLFLQDGDYAVPQGLLRVPSLKEPDRLPRFLTDEQVRALRDDLEQRGDQATQPMARRNALLDRAAFYLLWQAGLRVGEVEELRLEDLDLPARKLMVCHGKGLRDRPVYLTDATVLAVQEYLAVRGLGPDSHVLLYRNEPVKAHLLRGRIQAAGERVGVKVHPHRLRHTFASQLLNAGCRITSIQKLLGHQRLNSTMIYARVHDQTAADDYYAAMARIEARLELAPPAAAEPGPPIEEGQRAQMLELAADLAEPELTLEARLGLVDRLRLVLVVGTPPPAQPADGRSRDSPQPVLVFADANAIPAS
ncbi:MAG: tyrosine-type recombinase/integrase, partial [Streptosporangiaceae bacterium]